MSTKFHQTTARIYEFPRRMAAPGRPRTDNKANGLLGDDHLRIEAASGWYHEAALRDADRTRKP